MKLICKVVALGIAASILICAFANSPFEKSDEKADTNKIERHDVVIVGGGISGLTCGYFLKNSDVLILEKNDKVGGRTISGMHNSFSYAKGTEYLGTPENPLDQMIKELKLSPKEIPSPMDGCFDGKNFYYGSDGIKRYLVTNSANDAYSKFVKLILDNYKEYDEVTDLTYNEKVKALDNITAKQWLLDNKIPEVFIEKYNVASKGLFGANLDEVSALSFIPEAAFDYLDGNNVVNNEDYSNYDEDDLNDEYENAKEESSKSYTFTKGLTELTDKLGNVLKSKIRLNSKVVDVIKKGTDYQVTYIGKDGNKKVITAKKVVLAVSAPEVLKIAPTVLSTERTSIMKTVNYSSYATVAMFSKTPIFSKAFDLAVPNNYVFTDIYDSTWVEQNYDKTKEQKDYIISAYVAPKTYKDHSLDAMTDKELIKSVTNDLDKVYKSASSKITGYDIERFPYAYPVMSLGAYKRLSRLNELNTGSLVLAGDYMIYPTFEAAAQSGYLAAEIIKNDE